MTDAEKRKEIANFLKQYRPLQRLNVLYQKRIEDDKKKLAWDPIARAIYEPDRKQWEDFTRGLIEENNRLLKKIEILMNKIPDPSERNIVAMHYLEGLPLLAIPDRLPYRCGPEYATRVVQRGLNHIVANLHDPDFLKQL